MRTSLILLLSAGLLAGCGGSPAPIPGAQTRADEDATLQVGDTTVRATALQTSLLGEPTARQYGIERDERLVMLMVGVRRGPSDNELSVPAKVTATVTDLRGQRSTVALSEIQSGELVDHIGTVRVALPDTLRFDLTITRDGEPPARMQFTREFLPL